jgi:chromosome segregation ATPase
MVSVVAEKKTTSRRVSAKRAAHEVHGFTVILEDLRSQFAVFGEALQGLREHIDTRFEQVDRRFEQVDAQFADIHRELGLVKAVALEHGRQLSEHGRLLAEHGEQLGVIRKTVASIENTIVEAALLKRR